MSVDLIIRYMHDMTEAKDHVCTGQMFYRPSDGALPPYDVWEFEKTPFNKLLAEASNRMNKSVDVEVDRILIERTDRQGLQPIVLDKPTKEILKADPALAIKLLTYDNRGTSSGRVVHKQEAPPPMRSGYDSLAEAIGEEVYCRIHKGLVECPGCGMWSSAIHPCFFTCRKKCLIANVPVLYTEQWARFKTVDLLQLMLPRLYIPRDWNPHKPWISKSDLEKMYLTWKQTEKKVEKTS